MDKVYIDCEFDGHNGPLLSIAIVPENGGGAHIKLIDALNPVGDPWVAENVIPLMDSHAAPLSFLSLPNEVGTLLRAVMKDAACPVIIADSPVDIGRFCAAISTGADGNWASCDYPQMTFEVHNVDCYPTDLPGAVQHNAWWDAMALREKLDPQPKGSSDAR